MEDLIFEIINYTGVIKINRPKYYNALNRSIINKLDDVLDRIEIDSKIKVLIIFSEDNFAAGADIKEMITCNKEEARLFSFTNSFQRINNLSIPTIAAMDGYALGGGLELALACDFRIATKTTVIGFPEINLGIMPGAGGIVRASRLIGESRAKEMILLGDSIDANKAERIGLINKIVEKENLIDEAMEWSKSLCEKAPIALRVANETIKQSMCELNIQDAIAMEHENWIELFNSKDQEEGMRAFMEKRKPVYTGE